MEPTDDAITEVLGGPDVAIFETHGSRVFLHQDDVFKVKKPVRFPFLDYTTLALRKRACEEEIRVNRRTSPDAYLGVRPILRSDAGSHTLGPLMAPGAEVHEAEEWVVHMRRLPDSHRADERLEAGTLEAAQIQRVAEYLANFHAQAQISLGDAAPETGTLVSLREKVLENLEALAPVARATFGREQAMALRDHHLATLHAIEPLLNARLDAGRVVDGHGDFRLEHVYLTDTGDVTLLDAIEFDASFRIADVCGDVGFLAMDLCSRGRTDLAEAFVAAYTRETGDHDLYALIDFFMTYWALVRAKVDSVRAEQLGAEQADALMERCTSKLFLASHLSEGPGRGSSIVAVSGLIASGKSRVARALGVTLAAPVLSSDRVRKQLAERRPTENLGSAPYQGAYSEAATRAVYEELNRRAEVIVHSGRPVVVDASFQQSDAREALIALAEDFEVPLLFVECKAPRAEIVARLERRSGRDHDSDARAPLLEQFQSQYPPWTGRAASLHVCVDTTRPRAAVDREVLQHARSLRPVRRNSRPARRSVAPREAR